jgi:hypothetical protein
VVVVVVIALVAGLGAYGAYRIFQTSDQQNGGGSTTTTTTSPHIVDISGNSLTETVPISTNSTVNISCNYCNITLQLSASNVRADLDLSGNYNHVTITHGETNISVSGNYNTVYAGRTVVLNVQNYGNGNTIQR